MINSERIFMFKGISTNLMVRSVEDSLNFYQNILGFKAVATAPGESGLIFAILEKDGQDLMIQEKESLASEYPILKADLIKPSIALYIIVDNFEELCQDLKSKIEILADIHITPYGAEEFAVADPDGYVLTFAKAQN